MPRILVERRLRPIRLGFVVTPGDLDELRQVLEINTVLWGGRHNLIIPGWKRCPKEHRGEGSGRDLVRYLLDAAEPDFIVVGQSNPDDFGLNKERVIPLADMLNPKLAGQIHNAIHSGCLLQLANVVGAQFPSNLPIPKAVARKLLKDSAASFRGETSHGRHTCLKIDRNCSRMDRLSAHRVADGPGATGSRGGRLGASAAFTGRRATKFRRLRRSGSGPDPLTLSRDPVEHRRMKEWYYRATAKASLKATWALAHDVGFLCRSLYKTTGPDSLAAKVSRVSEVDIGDLIHFFYSSSDKNPEGLGTFRVIDSHEHPRRELFGKRVPESALYVVLDESPIRHWAADACEVDPRLGVFTGWLLTLVAELPDRRLPREIGARGDSRS